MTLFLIKEIVKLNNQLKLNNPVILLKYSNIVLLFVEFLYFEGYISFYKVSKDFCYITIYLKSYRGKCILTEVVILSNPGTPTFVRNCSFWQSSSDLGLLVVKTNVGFFSSKDIQRVSNGGELVCYLR
mmetsp:Transcript_23073/g.50361  ORF Transcript_23073/g.50361 Transcript_23073/m.50361 type:complete len:128 (-) Transcript_23073:3-386(-)